MFDKIPKIKTIYKKLFTMENHELENEIEMRMNPVDFSLAAGDMIDIMNTFGIDEQEMAEVYSKIVELKREEIQDSTKEVMNYFRDKGNYYPSFQEFKIAFNQYDSTHVDDNILRDMHKREIHDSNQMSMFEIKKMIKEEFRAMSEEDEFEKDAAAITKNWGGEIKKSKDAQLSPGDFEDIVDAGAVARGEIEAEFGEDEFSPMTDDEYKTIMQDLNEDEVEMKGLFRPKDSQGNDIKLKGLVSNLEGTKKGRVMGFGDDGKGNMIARVEWAWPMDMKFTAPEEMGMKHELLTDLIAQGLNEGSDDDYGLSKLRGVRVTYADGSVIPTSMAAHLTDDEIYDYFKPGKMFNIGSVEDNMQAVDKVEIIREDEGEELPGGDHPDGFSFDRTSLYKWFQDALYQLKWYDEAVAAEILEKAFERDYDYKLKMNEMNEELNEEEINEIIDDIDASEGDELDEARGLSHSVKNSGDRNVKKDDKDHSHAPVTTLPEGRTLDEKIKTLSEGKIKKKDLIKFINEQAKKLAQDIREEEKR